MRYALLFNPIAGRGRAVRVAEAARGVLESTGAEIVVGRSERAGHIEEMACELAGSVDRVLALGGDGSLREAAKGLLQSGEADRVALGVLPLGNGNVVAREAGMSLDPVEAARELEAAEEWTIDAGWARPHGSGEKHLFLAMAGFGFDASVAERIGRARSREGSLGASWYRRSADTLYGFIAAREIFLPRPERFRVQVDGELVSQRGSALIACNVRTYAKGMAIVPHAAADDGRLDFQLRESRAPWATAAALGAAQLRRNAPGWAARYGGGVQLVVTALDPASPVPWQLDGDPMERASRVEVRLDPGALKLLRYEAGAQAASI